MKTGLVLEGGGMRGAFTTGVLDFFAEKNVHFDNIIGVSAGACHAVSYVSKQPGRALRVITDYLDDKRYCGAYSLLTTGDLFGVKMIYDIIPNQYDHVDYDAFNENPLKMQAVISNSITGKAEYPYINDLRADLIAVRASSSLPLVSRPVYINGTPYFDGGICDSIPLRKSEEEGFEKNVVVLTQPRNFTKKPTGMASFIKLKMRKYPKLIDAMNNRHIMYNNTLDYIKKQEAAGKVFVIAPDEPLPVKRVEKDREKLIHCHKIGYDICNRKYNELVDFLNK